MAGRAAWEAVPDGWQRRTGGWNVESVARIQESKWPAFSASLQSSGPVGINHEVSAGSRFDDLWGHNSAMVFGYVLALAARNKAELRILDWGGGIGHYQLLAKALLPGVRLQYASQDVQLLAQLGRRLLPDATFFDQPERFLQFRYDLVLAVSSLWYEHDWRKLVEQLVSVCDDSFYLSRMIVVDDAPTFTALQRPWAAGYMTEYVCWIFNRAELVAYVESCGMRLGREFLQGEAPYIHHAPEQGSMRGFLFRRETGA